MPLSLSSRTGGRGWERGGAQVAEILHGHAADAFVKVDVPADARVAFAEIYGSI